MPQNNTQASASVGEAGMIAKQDFCGRMGENRTLITVMNLSGKAFKAWHLCGLGEEPFWL